MAKQGVVRSEPPRFYDVRIRVPPDLVTGKEKITLRFKAKAGDRIATVFGVRLIRGGT